MCLIITGQAKKVKHTLLNTPGLLKDIHETNSDGIGIMYGTVHGLKVVKKVPRDYKDARRFVERFPDDERQVAIHFRWTTHGDTDLENCHPYPVVEGKIALMHNGILRTDNVKDKTKSDTWHFVNDFLRSPLQKHPDLVHDVGFCRMVEEFIDDNNRFVFMDDLGKMQVLNKDAGIEHDGMWFSNTYAWTPGLLIPGRRTWKQGSYGWDDDDDNVVWGMGGSYPLSRPGDAANASARGSSVPWWQGKQPASGWVQTQGGWVKKLDSKLPPLPVVPPSANSASSGARDFIPYPTISTMEDALAGADVDTLVAWLDTYPMNTLGMLTMNWRAVPTNWTKRDSLTTPVKTIYDACIAGDRDWLMDRVRETPDGVQLVAEVAGWYLNWKRWPDDFDAEGHERVGSAGTSEAEAGFPARDEFVEEVEAVAQRLYEGIGGVHPPWDQLSEATKVGWYQKAYERLRDLEDLAAQEQEDERHQLGDTLAAAIEEHQRNVQHAASSDPLEEDGVDPSLYAG